MLWPLPLLSNKAGWSWGCVSAIDSNGRTIWVADAHRDGRKRLVVRADRKAEQFCGLLAEPYQTHERPLTAVSPARDSPARQ
ncbi:MAG: hypothetical protein DME99_05090 [Verrucomicrobia bacterium]|nr:MAG: hypothetical protein DME99_05090 [Verrucomicrobiota bacterium]